MERDWGKTYDGSKGTDLRVKPPRTYSVVWTIDLNSIHTTAVLREVTRASTSTYDCTILYSFIASFAILRTFLCPLVSPGSFSS